jgi:hypothetical protein
VVAANCFELCVRRRTLGYYGVPTARARAGEAVSSADRFDCRQVTKQLSSQECPIEDQNAAPMPEKKRAQ